MDYYPGVFPDLAAYSKPRADLVAILLTGIPAGIIPGFQNFTGETPADLLRLNTAIPPAQLQTLSAPWEATSPGFPMAAGCSTTSLRSSWGPRRRRDPSGRSCFHPGRGCVHGHRWPRPRQDRLPVLLTSFPYLGIPYSGFRQPQSIATSARFAIAPGCFSGDQQRLDPAGRRAGAGDGSRGHLEEPSLQAVQEPARAKAGDIDERVNAFLERSIEGEWRYLWLDATYLKVRDGGHIVSVAAIIPMAVNTDGRREIVGLGSGPSEAEPFWSAFLKAWSSAALSRAAAARLSRRQLSVEPPDRPPRPQRPDHDWHNGAAGPVWSW